MKRYLAGGLIWMLAFAAAAAGAQPGTMLTPKDAPYDPDTVTTIEGEVLESGTGIINHNLGLENTVGVVIRAGQEDWPVILAPTAFLEQQQFQIEKGDRVQVTGSRIAVSGQTVIVAREMRKGDAVLILRSPRGTPRWINPSGL